MPIIADYSMKVADRDYGSWWKDLQAEGLRLIEAKKETLAQLAMESDWISTEEAKKLLGIKSKSKMQQLRDYGEIVFTKPGKIILYSKKSIITYLNKHQSKWEL